MPDNDEVALFAAKAEAAKLPVSDGALENPDNDPDGDTAQFEDPDFDAGAAVGEDTGSPR